MKASFHGIISEIEGISCDNFTNLHNVRAYFLSHIHKDHTVGIESNELFVKLRNRKIKIYMSLITFVLLDESLKKAFEHNIVQLDIGTHEIMIPAIYNKKPEYLTVKLIPSGHCPGSVMFLFITSYEQIILFTGDFRIWTSDIPKHAQLHDSKRRPLKLDAMYVDTTFIDMDYQDFPKRTEIVDDLVKKVNSFLSESSLNRIYLQTCARFNYEFIFIELFKRTGFKICTDPYSEYAFDHIPGLSDAIIFDNCLNTRIHTCSTYYNSFRTKNWDILNITPESVCSIKFSAMKWIRYKPGQSSFTSEDTQDYACFSTHCSRSELLTFVSYFKPKRIIGFPIEFNEELLKNCFDSCLSVKSKLRKRPHTIIRSPLKKSVKHSQKIDREVIDKFFP